MPHSQTRPGQTGSVNRTFQQPRRFSSPRRPPDDPCRAARTRPAKPDLLTKLFNKPGPRTFIDPISSARNHTGQIKSVNLAFQQTPPHALPHAAPSHPARPNPHVPKRSPSDYHAHIEQDRPSQTCEPDSQQPSPQAALSTPIRSTTTVAKPSC